MTTYHITMQAEGETPWGVDFGPTRPTLPQIQKWCCDYVEDGSWDWEDGCVQVRWVLHEHSESGPRWIDSGDHVVQQEIDHAPLIRAAAEQGGRTAYCGEDPDDHCWEGEGGCDSNPGVWSVGGTTMQYVAVCSECGLRRTEVKHGSQRNPGEADSVEYTFDNNKET